MNDTAMHYRIELSRTRKGFARVQLPGRELAIEAKGLIGRDWEVLLTEVAGSSSASGTVEVRADDDNDAVWLVARAAVRAVSELAAGAADRDGAVSSRAAPT